MHSVSPFRIQYRLINSVNEYWTYDTLDDLFDAVRDCVWGRNIHLATQLIHDRLFDWSWCPISCTYKRIAINGFKVQTSLGDEVPAAEVYAVARRLRLRKRRVPPSGTFRVGAWPGIRRRKWHRGSFLRLVATFQEMTWMGAANDDLDEINWNKPIGRKRDLPSAWDDIPRHRQRSWKKHRSTQWKA